MQTYTRDEVTEKLAIYFRSINMGRPVTIEQSEVIGHVLMALDERQRDFNVLYEEQPLGIGA